MCKKAATANIKEYSSCSRQQSGKISAESAASRVCKSSQRESGYTKIGKISAESASDSICVRTCLGVVVVRESKQRGAGSASDSKAWK